MLELWRRRGQVPGDVPVRAYLIRAARNRALNHLRHERVVRRTAPHAPKPAPSPAADHGQGERELSEAVRRAVLDLPDRCREVFELSRVTGLTYGEIAATLEISIKTVEAQMGKALRLLRQRLATWLPHGPA
jgi:RNA polymerase sigma-70 factor (ECF subfamily)